MWQHTKEEKCKTRTHIHIKVKSLTCTHTEEAVQEVAKKKNRAVSERSSSEVHGM